MTVISPHLVVTTMLGGGGPTGVETHFNAVLQHARTLNFPAVMVTPYTGPRWRRALFRPLKGMRFERARVLYRAAQGRLIAAQLDTMRRRVSAPVTVYAQCPMSARAALGAARQASNWRVVLIVHYNQSESSEVIEKGIAAPGGLWCEDLERVERSVLPQMSKIVFASDYMRQTINTRLPGLGHVPQETILNFPREPIPTSTPAIVGDIVAIGTLEPRKNQGFLLQVLAKAREAGARYSLTLVGDGPDRKKLERLCTDLSLGEQVTFLGFRADASRLIPQHRVLAHAARLENCPLTLIEGLSYGRPLLAGAVGGIPEIFSDGVEGHFWDLNDPALAARRLMELLGNPEKYAQFSRAAGARYENSFRALPSRWVNMLMMGEVGLAA